MHPARSSRKERQIHKVGLRGPSRRQATSSIGPRAIQETDTATHLYNITQKKATNPGTELKWSSSAYRQRERVETPGEGAQGH